MSEQKRQAASNQHRSHLGLFVSASVAQHEHRAILFSPWIKWSANPLTAFAQKDDNPWRVRERASSQAIGAALEWRRKQRDAAQERLSAQLYVME